MMVAVRDIIREIRSWLGFRLGGSQPPTIIPKHAITQAAHQLSIPGEQPTPNASMLLDLRVPNQNSQYTIN